MPQPEINRRRQPSSYKLFLGVDGGGTKTSITLIDGEGEVVGEGVGGPSNPLRIGVETAVANIAKAIDAVCDISGLSRGDIGAATLGLAGVRRQDIRERVSDSFISRYNIRKTFVTTDADIALYGATFGKPGLVVIAGTGSICIGINDEGEKYISGGWGPIAGDEGGGRGIAGEALHRVAKASDGRGEPTKLSERAAEYFRASSVENLIGAIYAPRMDNSRIAGFARYVVETARDGDKIAVEILNDAGRELGLAAVAVLERLGLTTRRVPIGCVGSVFNAGQLLIRPMSEVIFSIAPLAYLIEPKTSPSHAAALMALENGINARA
jgi:N-acetylglucosamine kinase-like BadF-type ATPase